MSGVNKVILVGRLGKDPETRQVGDTSVTEFSLATSEKWTDKRSGEIKEKAQWHNIEIWGRAGEVALKYLSKGDEVYVEGSLDYQTWEKKDGGKGYKTIVKVFNLTLIGGKKDRNSDRDDDERAAESNSRRSPPERQQPRRDSDFDDEIPF